MTGERDVEARLRASLHAYADAVEVEPARPPVRAARARRSPARPGWRTSILAAAAVLAVAGGTWVVLDGGRGSSPTAASGGEEAAVLDGDARVESAPEAPPSDSSDSSPEAAPGAAQADELSLPVPAEIGVAYPFDLYTHCGIDGADLDGDWGTGGDWFAADPPLDDGAGNPPAGWGNPGQRGTLTLESTDVAVFRDDAGHEVTLRAAPDSERPPICA